MANRKKRISHVQDRFYFKSLLNSTHKFRANLRIFVKTITESRDSRSFASDDMRDPPNNRFIYQ